MEPLVYTPTYEIFLVLSRVSRSLEDVARALRPLVSGPLPEPLGSDIYYRRETDVALLAIRFDEREVDHAGLSWLDDLATGAGVPILDPTRLSEPDRRRFYASYLNSYEVQIEDQPGPAWAVAELARQLGVPGHRRADSQLINPEDTQVPIWVAGEPTLPPHSAPRPRTQPPPLPAKLQGRRLGSTPPEGTARPGQRLLTEPDPQPASDPSCVPSPITPSSGYPVEPLSGPITAVEPVESSVRELEAQPRGKQRQRTRRDTMPATPLAKTPLKKIRKVANGSGPHSALNAEPPAPPAIDVRFLRGSDWQPARLRSLSLKGAFLLSGALPRVGDTVYVALGFGSAGAMLPGQVYHVTPVEGPGRATVAGFALHFAQDDSVERQALIALLKRARAAGVTIKPPPARIAVRFPVRWPVQMRDHRSELSTAALDVSTGGMFVRSQRELPGGDLVFQIPLDNDDAAIRGRARAVRRIDEQMAMERGLQAGYGLVITELSDLDERRWTCFLERVRKRAERQVVIGAGPERLQALSEAFVACGYAVAGANDAETMFRILRDTRRPPDGALVDPTMRGASRELKQLAGALATLGVPTASSANEVPVRARVAIDRLLAITN